MDLALEIRLLGNLEAGVLKKQHLRHHLSHQISSGKIASPVLWFVGPILFPKMCSFPYLQSKILATFHKEPDYYFKVKIVAKPSERKFNKFNFSWWSHGIQVYEPGLTTNDCLMTTHTIWWMKLCLRIYNLPFLIILFQYFLLCYDWVRLQPIGITIST